MKDKDKRLWDEVLGGIDEKFIAETAERLNKSDDSYVSEKGVELKAQREEKRAGKRFGAFAAVFGTVAAAAVVGVCVWTGLSQRTAITAQDSVSTSGVTLDKAESGVEADLSGLSLYDFDSGVFEEYFIGEWETEDGAVMRYSYIGESGDPGFGGGLYSVGAKDDGYYLVYFSGGSGQVLFIPAEDSDSLYYYDSLGGISGTKPADVVFGRVSSGSDADRVLSEGNYLSGAALRRLDSELGGALFTAYGDIAEGVLNDNEGCEWAVIRADGAGYEAPRLASLGDNRVTLCIPFCLVSDPVTVRGIYLEIIVSEDGSWLWSATDADGRKYFLGNTDLSFGEELDIYERYFMGDWTDENYPENTLMLSYTEDFFDDGLTRRYSGYGNYGSCYVITVDVLENAGGAVPETGGNMIFAVYTADAEHMYCYTDGSIDTEPYAVYRRTGEADMTLPNRGKISCLGMHKLMNLRGGELPVLFLSAAQSVECGGTEYTDGGAPYYILSSSDGYLTVMMDYYGRAGAKQSIAVSFADREGGWKIDNVEKATEMTADGARLGETDDGYYYLTTEIIDGAELLNVCYYSKRSGVMYELNAKGNDDYRLFAASCCSDGDRLYVFGFNLAESGGAQTVLAVYEGGKRLTSQVVSETVYAYADGSVSLCGGYILAEWYDASWEYALFDPSDIGAGAVLKTADEAELDRFLEQ
ncbi:MAG: hypothetical protein ACI4XA_02470 [Oscillospiraceae bacterium]